MQKTNRKKHINENIKIPQNITLYRKPIIRQRKDMRKQKREEERKGGKQGWEGEGKGEK